MQRSRIAPGRGRPLRARVDLGGRSRRRRSRPTPAAPPASPPSDIREGARRRSSPSTGSRWPPRRATSRVRPAPRSAAAETPAVGTVRQWLGLDDFQGRPVPQGLHAARRSASTSRSGSPTTPRSRPVTAVRSRRLDHGHRRAGGRPGHQFDTNMYPKETAAFSTPPDRDGTNASSARTPTATAASTPAAATRPSRWSTTCGTTTTTRSRPRRPTSPGSSPRSSTSCSTAT